MGNVGYKDLIIKEPGAASEYVGMDFPLPLDLACVAESMGVHARRIKDPGEIAPKLEHALGLGRPSVLENVIDGSLQEGSGVKQKGLRIWQ